MFLVAYVTPCHNVTQAAAIRRSPGLPSHSVPDVFTLSMFSWWVENNSSESCSVGEISKAVSSLLC